MINYNSSCHCGSVKVTISNKPEYINACNCNLCSKTNNLWGYYNTTDVEITGETQTYRNCDKPTPAVELHSCKICSSTTHWFLTEEYKASSGINKQMGVNMRLFDRDDLIGVEVRFPDTKHYQEGGTLNYRKPAMLIKPSK